MTRKCSLIAAMVVIWMSIGLAQTTLVAKSIVGKTPFGFESEINAFLKADSVSFPESGGYLFVGSSTIRKWTNLTKHFPEIRLLQRGFGGSNMATLNFYTPYIVLPYKPDTIVVYEGDNDLTRKVKPEAFVASCDTFVRTVHHYLPNTFIYFISIKPSPSRKKFVPLQNKANFLLQDMLSRNSQTGFIDIRQLMYNAKGQIRKSYFEKDMLHLTDGCYQLWAEEIKQQMNLKKQLSTTPSDIKP